MRLFEDTGVHVLVDGQYGSTGKGVLAAWLAEMANMTGTNFEVTVSNAGPNSGHTSYFGDRKIVLKQLPTFAVISHLLGRTHLAQLSAGAVIDPIILRKEALEFPGLPIMVHPNAAVITVQDREAEQHGSVAAVAGTRSGTGAAIARKVLRDPLAVWGANGAGDRDMPSNVHTGYYVSGARAFMEISQGFSLGLNQRFYPKCTSRECTVSQGLADAGLPPRSVAKTYMTLRTYPIRVGNVDGFSSGDWYGDQDETSWEEIGQTPELTTVTQRVRRVATFSRGQLLDALRANDPDIVFINFMNYLSPAEQYAMRSILEIAAGFPGIRPFDVLEGYGPTSADVRHG